ncbi:MAG TPA: tetratricopeptide repeat protein [Terriglobales bacterium]|nr:tetratricopeptide repeat protein [Terriglobales bacterium]
MRRRLLPILAGLLGLLTAAASCAADPASPAELLSLGRVDDAIRLLTDRVRVAPNDAQAYNLLTRTYFYMGRWDDAAAAAERAVALEPSAADYQWWLGRAAGEKAAHSSFATAVRMVPRIRGAFERAVQLDGSNSEARTDLAQFYMEAPAFLGGGKDKALDLAKALAATDPSAAHWVKAQLAQRAKKFETAEQEYRAAIAADKHPGGRWLDLAGFYLSRGRLDQMEEAINKASSEDIGPSTVPYEAALLLLQGGRNFPGAIQLLQKYLAGAFQPEAAPAYKAHYLLGSILEKQGDLQAAAAEYRSALSLASEFDQARSALQRVAR